MIQVDFLTKLSQYFEIPKRHISNKMCHLTGAQYKVLVLKHFYRRAGVADNKASLFYTLSPDLAKIILKYCEGNLIFNIYQYLSRKYGRRLLG